jgi:hypothetical protein
MISLRILFIVAAFFHHPLALAQDTVQWGSSGKQTARAAIEGMKAFYEPDRVEHKGSVFSFALFRSATPGATDEVGRYMINCETRESINTKSGSATAPEKIL